MTQVARAFGQPFMQVWAAPYHETLFAFAGLVQREQIEGHLDHAKSVREAMRVNAAFAAPKELEKEHHALLRTLRRKPDAPTMTKDDTVRFAHEILTRAGFTQGDV